MLRHPRVPTLTEPSRPTPAPFRSRRRGHSCGLERLVETRHLQCDGGGTLADLDARRTRAARQSREGQRDPHPWGRDTTPSTSPRCGVTTRSRSWIASVARTSASRIPRRPARTARPSARRRSLSGRSEEHTSELQSLMRISYAVFCLKNKSKIVHPTDNHIHLTHQ